MVRRGYESLSLAPFVNNFCIGKGWQAKLWTGLFVRKRAKIAWGGSLPTIPTPPAGCGGHQLARRNIIPTSISKPVLSNKQNWREQEISYDAYSIDCLFVCLFLLRFQTHLTNGLFLSPLEGEARPKPGESQVQLASASFKVAGTLREINSDPYIKQQDWRQAWRKFPILGIRFCGEGDFPLGKNGGQQD